MKNSEIRAQTALGKFLEATRFADIFDPSFVNQSSTLRVNAKSRYNDLGEAPQSQPRFYPEIAFDGRRFMVRSEDLQELSVGPNLTKEHLSRIDFLLIEEILSEFFDLERKLGANGGANATCLSFELLSDLNSNFLWIGAVAHSGAGTSEERLESVGFPEPTRKLILSLLPKQGVPKVTLLSLVFNKGRSGSWKYERTDVNLASRAWDVHRSMGKNIPLIIGHMVSGKEVSVVSFVDSSEISWDPSIESPRYDFVSRNVVFDLDGTLVSNARSIPEVSILASKLRKAGWSVNLLTRNNGDIDRILFDANIEIGMFDNITQLSCGEPKSLFVKEGSVFVDDEFNQRLDVRINTKSQVLDLDQVDFFPPDL